MSLPIGERTNQGTPVTWGRFRGRQPDLASAGLALFCQFGVGLAFLATVRPDGGARLHPICVVVTDEALFGLIIPSLKLQDLHRDGRYTLHSYPSPENEDAFYLTGTVVLPADPALKSQAIATFIAQPGREGPPLDESHFRDQTLVEFLIETCLLTRTTGHSDPAARHSVWKAAADR